MSLRVIFFDAVDTLMFLPKGAGLHYSEAAARQGWDIPPKVFQPAFFAVYKEMPARPVTRGPRADDDKGWWRELVMRVLDRCAVPAVQADRDAYFEEVYAAFARPGVWQLFPETKETLEALRPHFTLGIISNFDGRLRSLLDQFGITEYFQHIIISSEVGADKPDPWIFECALRAAQVAADEVLYVGDDPLRDWQGGEALGLKTFRLERPGNSLRDLVKVALGGE